MSTENNGTFENAARTQSESGILRELLQFLAHNRRWWMLPFLVVLLLIGLLVILSGTAAAPFIYTLF